MFTVVNFLKCVLLRKSSCYQLLLLRRSYFARCGGIFSDSIITNVLMILKIGQYLIKLKVYKSVPSFGLPSLPCISSVSNSFPYADQIEEVLTT